MAVLGVAVQLAFPRRRALYQGALHAIDIACYAAFFLVAHDAIKPTTVTSFTRGLGSPVKRLRIWGIDPVAESRVRVEMVDTALATGRETGRLGRNGNGSRPGDSTGGRHGGKGAKKDRWGMMGDRSGIYPTYVAKEGDRNGECNLGRCLSSLPHRLCKCRERFFRLPMGESLYSTRGLFWSQLCTRR